MRQRAAAVKQWGMVLAAISLLGAGAAQAQTVTFDGIELRVNATPGPSGSPTIQGGALIMSNGEYGAARSALSTGTYNLLNANWFTSFTMFFTCNNVPNAPGENAKICPGDGIAFVVTGGADTQIGGSGQDMGYAGSFENSLAFALQTFWRELLLGQNGSLTQVYDKPFGDDNENYQRFFDVSLGYDAGSQSLPSHITDGFTSLNQIHSGIALGSWAEDARIGFTASSGLASEISSVSNWKFEYTPATTTVPEPSTVLLVAAGLVGIVVSRRRKTN